VDRALEGAAPELKGKGVVHVYDRRRAGSSGWLSPLPASMSATSWATCGTRISVSRGIIIPATPARREDLEGVRPSGEGFRNLTPAQVGKATLPTKAYGEDHVRRGGEAASRSWRVPVRLYLQGTSRTCRLRPDVAKDPRTSFGRSRPAQFIKRRCSPARISPARHGNGGAPPRRDVPGGGGEGRRPSISTIST
jgi:hypothetical protein